MSYDLAVFAPRALSRQGLRAFVAKTDGLDVESSGDASVTVLRGARRRYSFTIDGPDQTEAQLLCAIGQLPKAQGDRGHGHRRLLPSVPVAVQVHAVRTRHD